MVDNIIKIGTRKSRLAVAQAELVKEALLIHFSDISIEIVRMDTIGDQIQDRSLMEAGGKGLFTKEIEEKLLDKSIDIAVHSMKDMATTLPKGLEISAVLPREDPRDAFFSEISSSISELPNGATVGTASLRRQSILLSNRPDLKVKLLRGSVETRLAKLKRGDVDATFLAVAGMNRLGMADKITSIIDPSIMLPAPAQGAVGIESRINDDKMNKMLSVINCKKTYLRITAEREFLRVLDGSCKTPIAALAEFQDDNKLQLRGYVARPNGKDGRLEIKTANINNIEDAINLGNSLGLIIKQDLPENFFKE